MAAWAPDEDGRAVITEAAFEAKVDAIVQRRLASSRAYLNAASCDEQEAVEERIARTVIAELEAKYNVL